MILGWFEALFGGCDALKGDDDDEDDGHHAVGDEDVALCDAVEDPGALQGLARAQRARNSSFAKQHIKGNPESGKPPRPPPNFGSRDGDGGDGGDGDHDGDEP